MNRAEYHRSLIRTISLVKGNSLCRKTFPNYVPVETDYEHYSTKEEYLSVYKKTIQNQTFSILLKDESALRYTYVPSPDGVLLIRYDYFQFPFDFPSYEEYLIANGLKYKDVRDEFKDAYEQELIEAPLKLYLTPIRYEYDETEYTLGIHPVSHIHIGYKNSIRIPACMILTPLAFTLFILQQCYFDKWPSLLNKQNVKDNINISKRGRYLVSSSFFDGLDKQELYIN